MGVSITSASVIVNVDRNTINANRSRGENAPPLRLQRGRYGKAKRGHSVAVLDAAGAEVARFIYSGQGNPLLACGARVVLVAHFGAEIIPEPLEEGVAYA